MKKFILILLVVMMIFSLVTTNVFAESDEKKQIEGYDHAPVIGEFRYDSEYAAKIAAKEQRAKAYYEAKMSGNSKLANDILNEMKTTYDKSGQNGGNLAPLASSERLDIFQVPQETDFWCGYAAIKSLLDYKDIDKTQSTIADEVYGQDSSCPWYLSNGDSRDQFPVPIYLTDEINFVYAPYPYGAAGSTDVEASDIDWRIISTIDSDHGLVVCGTSYGNKLNDPSKLPGYPAVEIGHWLAIDGYKSDGNEIWIIDPAKSDEVYFSDDIDAYYSVTTVKLAAFAESKGIVW
nr:C39 family peptidase [Sedimentibacter sp.]